jgi:hypothetical protein
MAIVYTIAGGGLYLYWTNRVGPGFWAIIGVLAAVFAWFGHFSPFTDQPPQHILHAYASPAAGWLAVGCLIALALTLVIMARSMPDIFGWGRAGRPGRARDELA